MTVASIQGDVYTISGLDAGLQALTFVMERDRTTVGELALYLGVARSRAHRVLRTLEARGFVAPAASGRGFVAGPQILRMGVSAAVTERPRATHRAVLDRCAAATGEDVHLATLTGASVLVVDGRRSPQEVSVGVRVGMTAPAHAMAGGKLLLSHLDDGQVQALLPRDLARTGPRTLTGRSDLLADLRAIRERGYALACQESEPGVDSVAVLLDGSTWRDRLALVVSCPSARGGPARLAALADLVRAELDR